jgi:ferritin
MIIVRYLLDARAPITVPAVDAPQTEFADPIEPVRLALGAPSKIPADVGRLGSRLLGRRGDFTADLLGTTGSPGRGSGAVSPSAWTPGFSSTLTV